MGAESKIQWTDHTWNVARGCTKVDEDCRFCFMYRQSLNGTRYDAKKVVKTKTVFNLPKKIKEPGLFFVSSLTDVFHKDIDAYRHEMWQIIRECPQHTFQILTKRPERIWQCLPDDWGNGYKNVWLGASVGHPDGAHRIDQLCENLAEVRFLSLEPLWGPLAPGFVPVDYADGSTCINWVIIGGESGNDHGQYRYRECKLEWIENIIVECKTHRVPVFVKQLGTHLAKELKLKDRHGGDWTEWPEHLRIREMPKPLITA